MHPPHPQLLSICTAALLAVSAAAGADGMTALEKPWEASKDPVAQMWLRWETGKSKPDARDEKSFVVSVLRELGVPPESQMLVFSKTSLQNALISPQTPRAVFFNDECYCGWAQGGMMELIGYDPEKGPQFYALTNPFNTKEKPVLYTSENCLSCHEGSRTNGVKGMLVRSVYVDSDGMPLLSEGSYLSGHESPLSERWGGWYVTGRHGGERHMGNTIASGDASGRITLDREKGANQLTLERFFATKPYVTNTSDIVALMILEHQCTMHNKLTDAGKSTREAMARQHDLQKAFGEKITDVPQGSALTVIRSQAEKVVKHLLFSEEYPLHDRGIEGSPAFQDAFRKNRIDTADGRSLKDLQLLNRLFKYRCSYMIYSKAFEALPAQVKQEVYAQLLAVLDGKNRSKDYAHLGDSERKHIKEILLETKKDLPAEWRLKGQVSSVKVQTN